MVNTINTLTERNKELLEKIEELKEKDKTEISREAQLKIIEKIQNWKKENIEVGDRLKKWLKKYGGHLNEETRNIEYIYPSYIMNNLTEDWPLWKYLASNANYELNMAQYLDREENPLDELLEMMLNSILRSQSKLLKFEGLKQKKDEEYWELKEEVKEIIKKKEEIMNDLVSKLDLLGAKEKEIKELSKELEEKEVLIGELEESLKAEENNADTHFEAIKVCENWYFTHHIIPLNKEVSNKSELLSTKQEMIEGKDKVIGELRNEIKTERELLMNARRTIEEKDELIKLFNKPLPKIPSKFKIFKSKVKTKFRHLAEKVKHQSQELVARIEVRTN